MKRSMRWTVKARCLFDLKYAERTDKAEGLSEPLTGTAKSPAGLLRAATESSS